MLFVAQIDDAVRVVDSAAKHDDRWLFIAALVILLIFVGAVIRWLVTHIEKKDEALERKDILHDEKLAARELEAKAERDAFLATIDAIRKQMEALTAVVTDHDKRMTKAHDVEMGVMIETAIRRREAERAKETP